MEGVDVEFRAFCASVLDEEDCPVPGSSRFTLGERDSVTIV
jgi:hypothetical protein